MGPVWSKTSMSFATLMVHVDLYDPSDARVRLAADLADPFKSTLIGIAACAPVPHVANDGFAAGQLMADQVRDLATRLEKRGEGLSDRRRHARTAGRVAIRDRLSRQGRRTGGRGQPT